MISDRENPGPRKAGKLWPLAAFSVLCVLAFSIGCVSSGPALLYRGLSGSVRPGPGEPYRVDRFRIGWYDDINHPQTPAVLKAAGFDSVMPYVGGSDREEIRRFLKAAEESGIGVHLDIPRRLPTAPDGAELEEYVRALRDSPAILSWYLYDEPEWKKVRTGLLEDAYARIKKADPGRPVSLVFMFPSASGPYRGAMDGMWIDWYPVRAGYPAYSALRDGKYADRLKAFGRRADLYGLPLTIVSQGYGERKDGSPQFGRRLPTPEEARYMFYASFLARPAEILYWTLYRTRDAWLRDVLEPIVRDFRARFPDSVEYGSPEGFRVKGGRVDLARLGNGRGGEWLLILNREGRARTLRVTAPRGYRVSGQPDSASDALREIGPHGVLLVELVKQDDGTVFHKSQENGIKREIFPLGEAKKVSDILPASREAGTAPGYILVREASV